MNRSFVAFALAALAGAAAAQAVTDSFPYPDGTTVPGWTEKRGDWIVLGGRVHTQTASTWSYMTKDGLNVKDCVTEITAYYEGATSLVQFGGCAARHNGGAADTNLLMCKIQDNTTGGTVVGFDSLWAYERGTGGGAASQTGITPALLSCRIRFVVVNNQATALVDYDMNGTWDTSRTRTVVGQLLAGDTGVNDFFFAPNVRGSGLDDFAYYDGVLTSTGTPNVGGTLTLNLRGQLPGATYQAACSLSNSPGISIDTRRIPLTPDAFMIASFLLPSIFVNFAGSLDATASATASINIPSDPALIGFTFYTGFVEVVPTAPSGIGAISNDLPTTIVQ